MSRPFCTGERAARGPFLVFLWLRKRPLTKGNQNRLRFPPGRENREKKSIPVAALSACVAPCLPQPIFVGEVPVARLYFLIFHGV